MNQAWCVVAFVTSWLAAQAPVTVQFARSLSGRMVKVCIDGKVEETFAGKLGFRDQNSSWQSVCADVRSPVQEGQFFSVRAMSSVKVGGNYAKAGNIVARYFRAAQTPDQCAGLQIAVWKAIEDGTDQPNWLSGHFQVQASPAVITYAQQYYQALGQTHEATLLATAGAGQGQLIPSNPQ